MKKLVLGSLGLIILLGSVMLESNSATHAERPLVTQLQFAGYSCSPKGNVSPTWTYPDGIHAVQHPADPYAVSGQQQIQDIIGKMQTQEDMVAKLHANNGSVEQKTLNVYTQEYNALLAKYDRCVPLN